MSEVVKHTYTKKTWINHGNENFGEQLSSEAIHKQNKAIVKSDIKYM